MTTAMAFISDARQTSASAIRHLCQLGGPRSLVHRPGDPGVERQTVLRIASYASMHLMCCVGRFNVAVAGGRSGQIAAGDHPAPNR